MNETSRILTGGIMILLGLVGFALSIFLSFLFLIYAIPLIIIGFFIIFNKKEDKIEQINRKVFI